MSSTNLRAGLRVSKRYAPTNQILNRITSDFDIDQMTNWRVLETLARVSIQKQSNRLLKTTDKSDRTLPCGGFSPQVTKRIHYVQNSLCGGVYGQHTELNLNPDCDGYICGHVITNYRTRPETLLDSAQLL